MSKAEKFIQDCTRNCSNLAHFEDAKGNVWEENTPWLTPDQALRAVEIAKKEMIEKIKQLLKEKYLVKSIEPLRWVSWEKIFDDLKQATKDE